MADETQKVALFCDEAGKASDRYLAVGGLVVSNKDVTRIRREFNSRKAELSISAEAKWNLTRKATLDKHRSLVLWAFSLIRKNDLHFHCLLVDFQRFDHNLRSDGGPNESLKRMYYQLILHRLCKKHGKDSLCYAYVDKANELQGLDSMKRGLNSDSNNKFGCSDPLRALEFKTSHDEPLLQLNDLILGAICAQKNRRFELEGSGQHKANLAGFVLGMSGLHNYDDDTPKSVTDFTIWNLKSQYLKGGGAQL